MRTRPRHRPSRSSLWARRPLVQPNGVGQRRSPPPRPFITVREQGVNRTVIWGLDPSDDLGGRSAGPRPLSARVERSISGGRDPHCKSAEVERPGPRPSCASGEVDHWPPRPFLHGWRGRFARGALRITLQTGAPRCDVFNGIEGDILDRLMNVTPNHFAARDEAEGELRLALHSTS